MKKASNDYFYDDTPNEEELDYFSWFKTYHLSTLQIYTKLIRAQIKTVEVELGYSQFEVNLLLNYLEEIIKLKNSFPDTQGGSGNLMKLVNFKTEIETKYLNKNTDPSSYRLAQNIKITVSVLCNYMEAICED